MTKKREGRLRRHVEAAARNVRDTDAYRDAAGDEAGRTDNVEELAAMQRAAQQHRDRYKVREASRRLRAADDAITDTSHTGQRAEAVERFNDERVAHDKAVAEFEAQYGFRPIEAAWSWNDYTYGLGIPGGRP